jgi:hypothetical protein
MLPQKQMMLKKQNKSDFNISDKVTSDLLKGSMSLAMGCAMGKMNQASTHY